MENLPKRKYKKHKKGYKVSVTYFLKKDKNLLQKFFGNDNTGESPKFPVYVRVTFLQQTVGIHSRLSVRLTEDEFENYFQRQDVKDFVDIERTVILRSVEEFKPETIENLNISQWTKYYNEDSIEIKECAEMVIVERFREAINPVIKVEDKEVALSLGMMSSSIAYIKALNLLSVDVAQAYCKHYQTIFEIDKYEKAVLDTAEFTLWDWKLGLYQTSLRKVHGDNSNELLGVLTDLITEYQTNKFKY